MQWYNDKFVITKSLWDSSKLYMLTALLEIAFLDGEIYCNLNACKILLKCTHLAHEWVEMSWISFIYKVLEKSSASLFMRTQVLTIESNLFRAWKVTSHLNLLFWRYYNQCLFVTWLVNTIRQFVKRCLILPCLPNVFSKFIFNIS